MYSKVVQVVIRINIPLFFRFFLPSGHYRILGSSLHYTAKSLQSCPTLCHPIDGSPPGSPVPGILQARTLEWVAITFSSAWKWKVKVKSLSHVRPLATPMDCSLLGSSVHGIFQARVLEWGATAFSVTLYSRIYFIQSCVYHMCLILPTPLFASI